MTDRRGEPAHERGHRPQADSAQPDNDVGLRVWEQLLVDDGRGRLVPELRTDIGGERHRRQPIPVERDIRKPAVRQHVEVPLSLLAVAALPLEHRERRAPHRPCGVAVAEPADAGVELGHPAVLAPDRESLNRVVVASRDRPRADRQCVGGEILGVLEIAGEQRAHRLPDRRVPREQRLAQALGTGHERLHLRVDRVAVARLEEVDRQPGMGLQLELQISGFARRGQHLGRGLDSRLQLGRRPQHPAAGGARVRSCLRVVELLRQRQRLVGKGLHPAALG